MKNLLQSKRNGSAPDKNIRGSTLVIVMLFVVISAILGVAVLTLGAQSRLFAIRSVSEIAARCAADAGLTNAIYQMNQKLASDKATLGVWNADPAFLPLATNATLPNCDAVYSYTITQSGSDYAVTSTGTCGQAQKRVTCTLAIQGAFNFALLGNSGLSLYNGSTIDQYNTDASTPPLSVGTNSTELRALALANDSLINGDAVVGVGGNISIVIDNKGTITGNQYAMTEPHLLQSVTVPADLEALPSQGKLTGGDVTASGKYNKIDINAHKTVTIKGPVSLYVTGDIILGNSAQIIIDNSIPNSSLTIYLGGNCSSQNGSGINDQSQDPHKFELFGLDTCTSVYLRFGATFYGAIYAPKAMVNYDNSANLYGSVIADSFYTGAKADIHYDASLRKATINDEAVQFVISRWSE